MEEKMDFDIFKEELLNLSKKINITLDYNQIEKFYKYMNILLEWNEKINLTAITEPIDIILKHFIDSLTISKYIAKNAKIIDIGTGAGFPGIPIKIIREDVEIVLLDSLNKRVNFLNDVISKLDLKNIKAIHSRVEELGKNKQYREMFNVATSRAVANMSTLSEYLLPLIKENGIAICMKGSDYKEELDKGENAIKILGGRIEKIEELYLPNSNVKRSLIILKKVKNTPNKYPRKAGIPAKEPLN